MPLRLPASVSRPVLGLAAASLLAAAVVAVPAAPSAVAADAGCTVSGGTLTWGFKESFRSYISGSIAHGAWTPSDGASYATPSFTWSEAAGTIDAAGDGRVVFRGTVLFTGHNGLLNTTVANPVLVFEKGAARLLLDIAGVSMDAAMAGDTTAVAHPAVPFADLGALAPTWVTGEVAVADAPATVTPEGFAAFGNYEAGTPLDPVSFALQADCAPAAAPSPEPTAEPATAVPIAATAETDRMEVLPWVPWAIGGGVVVVLAGAVGLVVALRRGAARAQAAASDPEA